MSILDDILIKHLGLLPDLTTAWCCLSKSPSKRSHCTTIVKRLERFHQSLFSIFFLGLLIPLDWSSSWQFFLCKFKVVNIHGSKQFTRSEFFKQYELFKSGKDSCFFSTGILWPSTFVNKKMSSELWFKYFWEKQMGAEFFKRCWVTLW